jgi:hypothetical protein
MARVRFLDQVPVGFYDVDNGGGGNPGGPFSSIQYNDGGTLNGDINLRWDNNTDTVLLTGSIIATSFTGSLFGTSSWAVSSSQARTASYSLSSSQAQTASYVNTLNQNVRIIGSLNNGASNISSTGLYSHAEGRLTTASGDYSHTEGEDTWASGSYSHAEGSGNIASGSYSHAEGASNISYGIASHAEGASNISSGSFSHTEGTNNTAYGNQSHVEGVNNITYGEASHAEGYITKTYGEASHAEGIGTITSASYQHVQGAYNITSSIVSAFILGNGTSDVNRSNLIFAAGNQVQITGSLNTSGSVFFSTLVTSSTAVSNVVMYGTNGQLFITASTAIGGGGISGNYVTTASFNAYTGSNISQFAGTASFAQTASYVPTLKASSASVASFVGSPYSTSITFATAYPNNLYAVSVIGEDSRAWSISGKSPSGFTIDSNSSFPLTNPVYWIATPFNL